MAAVVDEGRDRAADEGGVEDAPDEEQPEQRQPPSEEEAEQDNYANTDDEAS